MKMYQEDIAVRGYELDSLGHVNQAQYLLYAETVRWNFLRESGLTHARLFEELGIAPVILKQTISYYKELKLGDVVTITSRISSIEGKKAVIQQDFLRQGDKVASLDLLFLFIDLKLRRSVALPQEIVSLL